MYVDPGHNKAHQFTIQQRTTSIAFQRVVNSGMYREGGRMPLFRRAQCEMVARESKVWPWRIADMIGAAAR
jgi:hypothetical protein